MDTTRITHFARRGLSVAIVIAICLGAANAPAEGPLVVRVSGREGIRLHHPTPVGLRLIGYAVGRYRKAGLRLPLIDVYFHPDGDGCNGRLGFERAGRVDLCVGALMNLYSEKIVLHELAHTWCEANLTHSQRADFDARRGVSTWNSWGDPWQQRGTEQAAEIIAWGLGEGTLKPMVSGDTSLQAFAGDFRFLTGSEPLFDISAGS